MRTRHSATIDFAGTPRESPCTTELGPANVHWTEHRSVDDAVWIWRERCRSRVAVMRDNTQGSVRVILKTARQVRKRCIIGIKVVTQPYQPQVVLDHHPTWNCQQKPKRQKGGRYKKKSVADILKIYVQEGCAYTQNCKNGTAWEKINTALNEKITRVSCDKSRISTELSHCIL